MGIRGYTYIRRTIEMLKKEEREKIQNDKWEWINKSATTVLY